MRVGSIIVRSQKEADDSTSTTVRRRCYLSNRNDHKTVFCCETCKNPVCKSHRSLSINCENCVNKQTIDVL